MFPHSQVSYSRLICSMTGSRSRLTAANETHAQASRLPNERRAQYCEGFTRKPPPPPATTCHSSTNTTRGRIATDEISMASLGMALFLHRKDLVWLEKIRRDDSRHVGQR